MRIDINLASQPFEDSRRFWTYWGTGLALLAIATALLVFLAITGFVHAGRDREQIAKLKAEIAAYDQEKGQAEALLNQPKNRELRQQSRFLNELFERKAFSWTRVFEDLEQVMPAHLHVLSIRPGVSTENNIDIKLAVGGESQEQALDLVRKMENSKRFKETRISSVRFATDQLREGSDRVQVEIEAAYTPSASSNEVSGGMH
jgi:type IV pilus assembly protein PilN